MSDIETKEPNDASSAESRPAGETRQRAPRKSAAKVDKPAAAAPAPSEAPRTAPAPEQGILPVDRGNERAPAERPAPSEIGRASVGKS